MPCFHPCPVWPAVPPAKGIVFRKDQSYVGAVQMSIPCSQCVGCRMDRAADWATRLSHEASCHDASSFVTLTYNAEHFPADCSVCPRTLQLFVKRLRKALARPVRFYACGEYGESNSRPHYHLLLFGFDFPDKVLWRRTSTGFYTYRSPLLESLWRFGHSEIGTVTKESAGYVARYVTKKITGDRAESHYQAVHPVTGEVHQVLPEFARMSNRPGIGAWWFARWKSDAFPSDFVVIDGQRRSVPRYYKKKLCEAELAGVVVKRKERARKHAANNTPERLGVREEVLVRKIDFLKRSVESDS